MKFFDYRTAFDQLRQPKLTISDFRKFIDRQKPTTKKDRVSHKCWLEELDWISDRRPYYNVYPSIVPMLRKIDLDKVSADHVRFPVPRLCIRFAEEIKLKTESLRCLLVSKIQSTLALWCDFGHDFIVWQVFPLTGNIGEQLRVANREHCETDICEDDLRSCVQIVVSLALIDEIIEPEILNADVASTLPLDILIDRAHRRGKVGWSVGKGIERCPHMRRPHLGVRWTGPGSSIPKIVPIKGSIVHRNAVVQVPTGVEDVKNQTFV